MKTNCWLILVTMVATAAVAQVNTNKLPEIPPPATVTPAPAGPAVTPTEARTNAPAQKHAKAKKKGGKKKMVVQAAAKKTAELPFGPVTLVPGPATVAAENLNLRGQAGLQGEVVGHVKKGDTVTVLAEITLDKPKAGEPAQWAKIALPSGTKVWVDSKYVDTTNNVVAVKKLNLRGGPGENYSVLGVIEKGAAVTSVATKGNWMQIETPASAFAFVAAHYLKQEAGMETNVTAPPTLAGAENVPAPTPPTMNPTPAPVPTPTPTPTTVAESPTIAPPATTPPPAPETVPAPNSAMVMPPPSLATTTPATTPTPATPETTNPAPTLAPEETDTNLPPPPPRIVTHEGTVRHSVSLVAPTYFELYDPTDNKAIDYLYSTSTNLNLSRYNGLHIAVTGQEEMDVRWKDTPVITIEKIYVLSSVRPAVRPALQPVKKPK
ncbi:MAG TPA: SH3 domain-containing protein [Candidatus Acidoferrales bacterium]|nr:SH3 domain-containing protein [Candidatus Acidoferrales bacterium]